MLFFSVFVIRVSFALYFACKVSLTERQQLGIWELSVAEFIIGYGLILSSLCDKYSQISVWASYGGPYNASLIPDYSVLHGGDPYGTFSLFKVFIETSSLQKSNTW